MARGRWRHTAEVVAMLLNVNRSKKSDPIVRPDEINPYARARPAETMRLSPKEFIAAVAARCGVPIKPQG